MLNPIRAYPQERALADLRRAEHDESDARADLAVINSSLRPGDELQSHTHSFLSLLWTYGKDHSRAVRADFQEISRARDPGELLSVAMVGWLALVRYEGDPKEAFLAVDRSLRQGETRDSATRQYLRLLETDRPRAVAHYRLVDRQLRGEETRAEVVDDLLEHFRLEDRGQDARDNFLLVDNLRRSDETRGSCTAQLARLLELEGARNSGQAQEDYRVIDTRVDGQHSRAQLTAVFEEVRREIDDPAAARQAFLLLTGEAGPGPE